MSECHNCQASSTKQLCVSLVPIFNHLTDDEMWEVADRSFHRKFIKGETIFQAEEPSNSLFIVHQGRVKIYRLAPNGKEQLIRILDQGDFFGEMSIFSEETLTSYAEAMVDTNICIINRSDIQELMVKHPAISLKILEEFSRRLDHTEHLVEQLSSQDVEKRIASYLIDLLKENSSESHVVKLPMSKKDLASMIGTTQETLSRRLTALQDKEMIEQTGQRKIKIIDIDQLQNKTEA
ncbi:Crp/Fnr family transcriptional regulator [Virgibacillus sp. MSP4-1]|uniref:Crp/Fnr family transcriptional regulator n=1 Tax=Virgibacillus sp. MSP4-1 TaxID=2700081 RepID=UPI0003A49EE5|nr:Crp/Fnr family transcriptional regulator [Virgibacillus sp. MSP4-1]QHS21948.1 Crp/Fnr family transcriptional regulator [Virgibacillus sp. MSP4-1]